MLRGVDVSQWQGIIDFNALRPSVDFCIIRSTYGNGYVDKEFTRNQSEARRVGLGVGYYHYSYPQYNNYSEEANWFVATTQPTEGEFLVLDFEEKYSGDVVAWCKGFLDCVSGLLNGYKPLIYLNQSQVQGYDWSSIVNAGYGVWVASYDNIAGDIKFNTPWPTVAIKQYTDAGVVPGVSGGVDLDIFYGDINTLRLYGMPKPMTASAPQPLSVVSEFTDQTIIPIGGEFGQLELQAVRSMLTDLRKNSLDLQQTVNTLQSQIVDLTNTSKDLSTRLENASISSIVSQSSTIDHLVIPAPEIKPSIPVTPMASSLNIASLLHYLASKLGI